ncbi:hypothetical protein [Aquimarina sp. 2304DJ70-9]|uniref:hypothetical protein n=1 Tax=Aquimarina penaris TaxID=3231044 RepID=UPI0034633858
MKVYGQCKTCDTELEFRTKARTRVQFSMKEGKIKQIDCKKCKNTTELHINDVYTKKSNLTLIVAILIFVIGILITGYFTKNLIDSPQILDLAFVFGACLFIPFTAFQILKKQDQNRVRSFNKLKVKEE